MADPIKESTAEAIRALPEDGIRMVMVTGDNCTTAEAVARKLGIDEGPTGEFHGSDLPLSVEP